MEQKAHKNPQRVRLAPVVIVLPTLAILVILLLQYGLGVQSLGETWDESYMQPVVADIVQSDWSQKSMIDYQDTKGPTLFWVYALGAELSSAELPSLRTITGIFFVLSTVIFGIIASYVGLRKSDLVWSGILFLFLPYHIVLASLFMSEPSYIFGSLILSLIYVVSVTQSDHTEIGYFRKFAGPILFCIIFTLLMHHRIHIVVLGGAVVFVAFMRDRLRCWPWVVACVVAGVLRLPLYFRWDGLVSADFQGRYGLGLRLDSLAYLLIAALPLTFVFLLSAIYTTHQSGNGFESKTRWKRSIILMVVVSCATGIVAFFNIPDLTITLDSGRYLGPVASALRTLQTQSPTFATIGIVMFTMVGGASLCALWCVLRNRPAATSALQIIEQLAFWNMTIGCVLYCCTRGDVYDRYVLPFAIFLPIVYVSRLPRILMYVQAVLLFLLSIVLVGTWLLV